MWAFSDESERAGLMLVGVVLVPPGSVQDTRTALRGLLLPGERQVHTAKESPRRRRVVLDTLAGIDELTAVALRYRRPQRVDRPRARHLLLQAATGLALASGVTSWVLDDQDPVQRARDRASIAHALAGVEHDLRPTYDHRPSRDEPLLWAADAVCWAVGAGAEWRRRIQAVLTVRTINP